MHQTIWHKKQSTINSTDETVFCPDKMPVRNVNQPHFGPSIREVNHFGDTGVRQHKIISLEGNNPIAPT